MPDRRFIYRGNKFSDPQIEPTRINESTPEQLAEIKTFFLENKEHFYFLFHENGELIGSILHVGNYIKSLCVSRKYQGNGYGEKLSRWCINRILDNGYGCVELDVLEGNLGAERLYRKIGFKKRNGG